MRLQFFNIFLTSILLTIYECQAQTTIVAWPFDEPQGIYPSCVINDVGPNDYPLVIGPGAMIVDGVFGNALEPVKQPEVKIMPTHEINFGLTKLAIPSGRTVEPMTWFNANFAALMTSGEKHLRKEVGFVQPTKTKLNLGDFDWTIDFWFKPTRNTKQEGVVFEVGTGPRAENNFITRLSLNKELSGFILYNYPSDNTVEIRSDENALNILKSEWHHYAFVYDSEKKQINHFVDGKIQHSSTNIKLESLETGDEDYMSIGRDGKWDNPLQGRIDELRFTEGKLFTSDFKPKESFSPVVNEKHPEKKPVKGPELLFNQKEEHGPINLLDKKHLFIDDALIEKSGEISFTVNPPKRAERVIGDIKGSFRKHLNVVEDEDGLIRIYNALEDDRLGVMVSKDGINFHIPDLPDGDYKGHKNIVLKEATGMGMVFIDPNAPPEEKWRYISDYHRRGIYIYSSPDGYSFKRHKIYVLPFRSGSQSNIFYDDQKQLYTSYHRSDFGKTKSGGTERIFIMTESEDVDSPYPFIPVTQNETLEFAKKHRVREPVPWYMDNGPLTPGGFSNEYPWVFAPVDTLDPIDTDIYVPKAHKYQWAPDTYIAFPVIYFHYEDSKPDTRFILMEEKRKRGSGPLETQLSVSRDGINWKRYPRPAYIGIGEHEGKDIHTAYIAHGMIKRGNEIWQYYFGETQYHSAWTDEPEGRGVYRLIQRLDGFVSIDSPYDKEVEMITKPLIFKGNRLTLNIDTDAAGYVQVGFLDENDNPIEGFSVDDCIYINGDFISEEVEWIQNKEDFGDISIGLDESAEILSKVITTGDVSQLEGRVVKLVFRMRGSKLYAMQFVNK